MTNSESKTPLVSVVVPFFDSQQQVVACVESLLRQQDVGGPYEVLFIDNGSTDASASLLEPYADLVRLEESTPGAYAARNTGIRRARAPLIAFTDADCVVADDWLRTIQDQMADAAVGILLGCCLYPESASLALRLLGAYENSKTHYVITRCPPAHRFAHANNMAIRASVFAEIGLFKEWRRAADTELVQRLAHRRPDLQVRYSSVTRVTHMEFVRARDRARRLSLYTRTNARVDTFQELGIGQRAGVLWQLLRNRQAYL